MVSFQLFFTNIIEVKKVRILKAAVPFVGTAVFFIGFKDSRVKGRLKRKEEK